MANAELYNNLFDLVRRILVLAQNKDIHSVEELQQRIPADVKSLILKFMDAAYKILPTWQYKDVRYYEGFIYAVLSQLEDLHKEQSNRAMMDIADLMIIHGDYGLGDANYNYVLRENELKDQIYYRFANVYRNIDNSKAKAIAAGALSVVDDRYDYYPKISQKNGRLYGIKNTRLDHPMPRSVWQLRMRICDHQKVGERKTFGSFGTRRLSLRFGNHFRSERDFQAAQRRHLHRHIENRRTSGRG
jgi:hypothetical protein